MTARLDLVDVLAELPPDESLAYRAADARRAAGITYRQLDHWARTGLVVPSIRQATGPGTLRLYSTRDVVLLRVAKFLLDSGVSLHQVRAATEHLHRSAMRDLAGISLVSDGRSVYQATLAGGLAMTEHPPADSRPPSAAAPDSAPGDGDEVVMHLTAELPDRRPPVPAELPGVLRAAEQALADLFANLPASPPTLESASPPTLESVLAALERFEADRPRLVVPLADRNRVQAALDSSDFPPGSVGSLVKVETSDLVPDGQAYLINPQAINEAIERREPWPRNAAVRWTQ